MPAEDSIFYFDLARRGVVKKKAIVKQVNKYIKKKEKDSPSSNWGLVVFRENEDNPSFIESLAKDETEFEEFLQDNLKFTVKSHPLEHGLMLASTYLVEAFRTTKDHIMRMIVISDGPTEGSNVALANALMDLFENLKYFPVFVDIIRIGEDRVYPDDIKLKLITDLMNGSVFYASNDGEFKQIMANLAEKEMAAIAQQSPELSNDRKIFFENLTWALIESAPTNASCIICNSPPNNKGTWLACENCGAPYHLNCVEEYTNQHKVILPNMFRCIGCECLLLSNAWKPMPVKKEGEKQKISFSQKKVNPQEMSKQSLIPEIEPKSGIKFKPKKGTISPENCQEIEQAGNSDDIKIISLEECGKDTDNRDDGADDIIILDGEGKKSKDKKSPISFWKNK